MLQRGCLVCLVLLLLPTVAAAQKVEITPFAGYIFGGNFDESVDSFPFEPAGFEIDEGTSLGVLLGVEVTRNLQVELIWSRQDTELLLDGGFFGSEEFVFDLDLTYLHAGVAYQWKLGQVRPFIAASAGVTELDPEPSELGSETRFSLGLGGGVKLMVAKNFGFRFEGRLLATDLGDSDDFCDDRHCDDDSLTQGVVRAGLIFAF